ncbi:MAG TPA: HlyD family secretion protein [Patescibacteria group bacterium]|nr:HlyD family secretion protein [Patescibacteria group bacterium]
MNDSGTVKAKKRRLVIVVAVLLILVAVGGGCWWIRSSRLVSTDDARVKGTIATASAKLTGRVAEVLVAEGDCIQAGQVVARLEGAEWEAQLAQAQAALHVAQSKLAALQAGNRPQEIAQAAAGLEQAQASLDLAIKKYQRILLLFQQGAISIQQRDTEQAELEVARAKFDSLRQAFSLSAEGSRSEDLQAAKAQVEQAEAALRYARLQWENTVVRAPVAGTVALKSVEAGEMVSVGQPMISIVNLNDVWVAANIEEGYVGKVCLGQPVEFTIDAYPGMTFHGRVSEVGAAAGSQFALLPAENSTGNFTKITQRLPVKVRAPDTGGYVLKPGMSAVIDIHVR